jgi:hypothetical protein
MYLIGSYQIHQAKSYITEHLTPSLIYPDDFEFIVELCRQHNDLIRVRFSSRHSSYKNRIATVQYDNDEEEPIQGWYCTCPNGSRVIGCCSHVAAVLWYLGVCRANFDTTSDQFSTQNLFNSIDDCFRPEEIEDDDDEDEDIQTVQDQDESDSENSSN